MSKNIKRIVVAAAAALAIVLVLVVLKYVFPEEAPPVTVTAAPTEEPVYYLIQRSGDDVRGFDFSYDDGSSFTLDIEPEENGKYRYLAEPADIFFGYNVSRFRSMMYTVSSLTATSKIEEAPEDLAAYGLDAPKFHMTVRYADGSDITLYLGNETPVKNYYYAMTDRDDTVYTIGNYLSSLITRRPFEYRSIDTFPTYADEEIYKNLTHFTVTRRDGTVVDIVMDKELNMEGNITSSTYMMTSPFVTPCNGEAIEALLDVLATVSFDKIIADVTQDELAEYGLDQPARLCLEDEAGSVLELVVGTVRTGSCYAVIGRQYDAFLAGETPCVTVLTWTMADFNWLDVDFMDIQIRTPWILNIHDVASLVYDFNGTVYNMELYEYDDVTGSGVDVVRTCSYINGKDIYETNTKRIYSRTLNFRQVGALTEDMVYEEAYAYSITIRMKDGTEHLMTFHKINERQYACVMDGVAEYYMYMSNIQNLTSAIERAMDDREVPMVYST